LGERTLEVPAGRRHIIKRPRLTRLLDAAESRLLTLVAPAGYGKTTLAREWLSQSDRLAAWYQAREASADIAALTLDLAKVVGLVTPNAGVRVRERVKTTQRPEAEVDVFAEMLAEDIADWPSNAWLIIDDYHYLTRSPLSEKFVERLSDVGSLNLMIASRVRPSWVTPRHLLYGDCHELSRSTLAMTHDEASAVLGTIQRRDIAGLIALAEGWPAVIGLAAMVDPTLTYERPITDELHGYFAEELFQAADARLQDALVELSLIPHITIDRAESLLSSRAEFALEAGEHIGFFVRTGTSYELHPLLRSFLRSKLKEWREPKLSTVLSGAIASLYETGEWDDLFALLVDFGRFEELPTLLEGSLYALLGEGRVATLERWLDAAIAVHAADHRVRLLQAEVLFRQGNWAESERLAAAAARGLCANSSLTSKAYYRAGQSALFGDRHPSALTYHQRARKTAVVPSDLSQALWGAFITQSELTDPSEAIESLAEFEMARTDSAEDELRFATSRLFRALRLGGLTQALRSMHSARHLLTRACDPVVRTGALQVYATALNLGARYRDALDVADHELKEATSHRLSFVLPHAYVNQAYAYLGLRMFQRCTSVLEAAEALAADQDDIHSQMNVAGMHVRLLVTRQRANEVMELIDVPWERAPNPGMYGDFLAAHALAAACGGKTDRVSQLVTQASKMSSQIDCRVQCAAAQAISVMRLEVDDSESHALVLDLAAEAVATGNYDGLVLAYRGFPRLIKPLSTIPSLQGRFERLLRLCGDATLARRAGVEVRSRDPSLLTPREREIHELLKQGFSNRAIAKHLWITETTVKVHVRHVFQKLGVRTRTEAALKDVD